MSSYANFAMPTCRQAAMQVYRVCKCAKDWKHHQSSALVKRQQQSNAVILLFSYLQSQLCFNTHPLKYRVQTQYIHITACLQVGVTKLMGVTIHLS